MCGSNIKHSIPWAEACSTSGVQNTPLSPFIEKDHIMGSNIQMNGSKLIKSSNFVLNNPTITADLLKEVYTYLIFGKKILVFIVLIIYRSLMTLSR